MRPSFISFLLGVTLTLSVVLCIENGRNVNAYKTLKNQMGGQNG